MTELPGSNEVGNSLENLVGKSLTPLLYTAPCCPFAASDEVNLSS